MNLEEYRNSPNEQLRANKLLKLIPHKGINALDAGARDGFLSIRLADYFNKVTAVDLECPVIAHDRVESKKGDITGLDFLDNSFDLVLCSEVLEHIPPQFLKQACTELTRVSKEHLIIGVPYKQDIRVSRLTCRSCNRINPPWGHVNTFDLPSLKMLFPNLTIEKTDYVGLSKSRTNFISATLMDWAGNPYGTYSQDEPCLYCGQKFLPPPPRSLVQRIFTRTATYINDIQGVCLTQQPNWIHILLKKQ